MLAALLAAALLPAAASAADFDYSYADLAYSRAHSDIFADSYPDSDGYRLDGSYGFAQNWFVEAAYQHDRFDFDSPLITILGPQSSITAEKTLIGAGFHAALAERLDLVAHLDYGQGSTKDDVPGSGFSYSADDDGYIVGVGLRFQATEALELDAGLDHDDLAYGEQNIGCPAFNCLTLYVPRQSGTENVFSAAARYRFGMWGVGIEYRDGNFQGWRDWLFSVRANF